MFLTIERAGLLAVLKPLAPDDWSRMATVTGSGKPREMKIEFRFCLFLNEKEEQIGAAQC